MAKEIDDNVVCLCTNKKCGTFMLITGMLLIAGGIIGLIISPIASKNGVKDQIPLTENSYAATHWINPPYNITMQFWIFNTTNPDELLRGQARPAVSQKGPYTYRQTNQKSHLVYGNSDNVSYIQTNFFYFDQSRSCRNCFESDMFTVPNAIYTTVAHMFRFKEDYLKRSINLVLMGMGERPFVTKTVSQLLFQGFEDQLLTLTNAMSRWIPEIRKYNLPKVFQYFPKNGTNDGTYEICVGNSDVKKMGMILSWNGKHKLDWWTTEEANKIIGTDGQLFPPYINRTNELPLFISDLCRSTNLTYSSDVYLDGLQAYRFILSPDTFDMTNPANQGFCQATDKYYPSQLENCLPSGLMNLSSCRGAPIILSMPHFLHATDEVVQSIDGIKPTPDHEVTWEIQPNFGSAMSVQSKFQINIPLYPDDIFMSLEQVKPAIIPLFWFNASATMDPGTRDYLYKNIVILQTAGYAITFASLLIGVLLVLLLLACCWRYKLKREESFSIRTNGGYDNRALIEETEVNSVRRNLRKV